MTSRSPFDTVVGGWAPGGTRVTRPDRRIRLSPAGRDPHTWNVQIDSRHPWWTTAVCYQIYVRSFADGNGDGVGDMAGIEQRLPYLADLGVDAREAVVLRETRSTVVDLAPAPVVARVWPAGQRDPNVVRRELAVTAYLAHAGAANALDGRITFVGVGRAALPMPDFALQLARHGKLDRRRVCRTFSYCTALMRSKHNELGQFATGCPPFDKEVYGPIWEQAKKKP